MQAETGQHQGLSPILAMILGSLTTLAPFLIQIIWKWYSRRRTQRRSDLAVTSQIELKRIDVEVLQSHERRDDLRAAQDEADRWMGEYYKLMVAAKEMEWSLKLELAQVREQLHNAQLRLRMKEKDTDDAV